jgi:hypothetical protein
VCCGESTKTHTTTHTAAAAAERGRSGDDIEKKKKGKFCIFQDNTTTVFQIPTQYNNKH